MSTPPVTLNPGRVNAIGGTLGATKKQINKEPIRYVRDPATGKVYEMTLSNAYDVVNHRKWEFVGKVTVTPDEAPGAPQVPTSEDIIAGKANHLKPGVGGSNEGEPAAGPVSAAMSALQALRLEAEALGIEVDNRWGVGRLGDEIAKAKAAQ